MNSELSTAACDARYARPNCQRHIAKTERVGTAFNTFTGMALRTGTAAAVFSYD
jgi:hypothetical protein